jgi:Dolichyl-phosphate-mannose-protein mannosyltransferase
VNRAAQRGNRPRGFPGPGTSSRPTGATAAAGLTDLAWSPVVAIATTVTVCLVSLASRYGPHRDELYFVAAGHHLAWGYPDQPALTPLVAAAADTLAHGNLVVLRLSSALVAGVAVIIGALTARELGGTRGAQLLTAVLVGTGVVTLVLGHLLSTASLDLVFWMVVILMVLRALGRDDPRWWVGAGLAAGFGLENKTLVAFLLVGLAVGVVVTPQTRHHLRSTWLWVGVMSTIVIGLPDFVWQASNGWPQLALSADINAEYRATGERIFYVLQQLILFSPLAGAVWVFGLVRLLRDPKLGWARPVGVAYLVLFVVFLVSGGKGYYVAGILPALAAVGCVTLAERWSKRRLVVAGAALALCAAVAWPAALPLLPPATFADSVYSGVGEDQLETIGWPAFVKTIRGVLDGLPADQRKSAVVYAENYGEAGALSYYRVGTPVFSGHNGFGYWGPPPEGSAPVVVVGLDHPSVDFTGCRSAGRIDNGLGVDNEEQGTTVWLCDGPRGGWQHAWPDLEHLDG